jgi:hypothetical protein
MYSGAPMRMVSMLLFAQKPCMPNNPVCPNNPVPPNPVHPRSPVPPHLPLMSSGPMYSGVPMRMVSMLMLRLFCSCALLPRA